MTTMNLSHVSVKDGMKRVRGESCQFEKRADYLQNHGTDHLKPKLLCY